MRVLARAFLAPRGRVRVEPGHLTAGEVRSAAGFFTWPAAARITSAFAASAPDRSAVWASMVRILYSETSPCPSAARVCGSLPVTATASDAWSSIRDQDSPVFHASSSPAALAGPPPAADPGRRRVNWASAASCTHAAHAAIRPPAASTPSTS